MTPNAKTSTSWSRKGDLSKSWLFAGCSSRELRLVNRSAEEVTVPAGRVLCKEGTPAKEFFFILNGAVVITRGGQELVVLGPGDYFGELALLDSHPRTATVTATEETTLLVLTSRAFFGLIETLPGLARKVMTTMAQRLRKADELAYHVLLPGESLWNSKQP